MREHNERYKLTDGIDSLLDQRQQLTSINAMGLEAQENMRGANKDLRA